MGIELPHNHGKNMMEQRISENMPETGDFDTVSEIFNVLSDSKRLQIFWILCHTEECVINLAAMLNATSPAVSHHLRILKTCNLIESRRGGKEVYYKVTDTEKTRMLHNAIERIMEISCPQTEKILCRTSFIIDDSMPESVKTAYKVHEYLVNNLEKRITIEDLAKRFLINPTTLKNAFKAEFGNSIAAHIKEHRMQKAAGLLSSTSMPVSEISAAVGFASRSKFSASFYEFYQVSPLEYRKRCIEASETAMQRKIPDKTKS